MAERSVAVAIFHDDKDIVVQIRDKNSKLGAKFGFWGGGVEPGETPDEAIKRELKEELAYEPDVLNYWTEHNFSTDSASYRLFAYVSPITDRLLASPFYEGEGMERIGLNQAILSGDFSKGDTALLKKFKQYLEKK